MRPADIVNGQAYNMEGKRLKEKVHFPLSFDKNEWSTSVKIGKIKVEDAPSYWYELYHVVEHLPSTNGQGHWLNYILEKDGQVSNPPVQHIRSFNGA